MLSILIPVFNFDVLRLVKDLSAQCITLEIAYEIIIIDDCSSIHYNFDKHFSGMQKVRFESLQYNIGRSRIRNLLASKANYENLLFLDCDSDISLNPTFINNYIVKVHHADVIYGGTIYQKRKPEFNYLLHWNYGSKVESPKAEVRNQEPYTYFKTNNFLVKKSVFDKVKFDESIINYGYEDNKFADDLNQSSFTVFHINNEVLHLGLNENEDFINKTESSLKSLKKLHIQQNIEPTRLIKLYNRIVEFNLIRLFNLLGELLQPYIKKLILKFPGYISLFQIWKLMTFCLEMKKPA